MRRNILSTLSLPISLLISLLFIFFQASFLFATENVKKMRVGYAPGFSMITDISEFDNEGYGYEILRKIEEKSDFLFEFIPIEGSVFTALENNEVDIIGLYFKTPEREKQFYYSQIPLSSVQTSLVARGKKNRIYDDPPSIDGKKVATYRGNLANASLDNYLAKHNISVDYLTGDLQNYKEFEADYYLAYSSDADIGDYNNVLNLDKRHVYLLSNPEKKEMLDEISAIVYEIVTTEGDFFEALGEKYTGESFHALHRSLTRDELQILRQKTLKVAYNIATRPYSFTNEQGKADGALVNVMDELAEKYKFSVEYLPYTFENPLPALKNCDVALSILGDMDYFKKHFTPSEAYMRMPLLALVPRERIVDNSESEEVRKASPKLGISNYLYANFDSYIKNRAPENEFIFFPNIEALLEAYIKREVDAALFSQASAAYVGSYLGKDESFPYASGFYLDAHLSIANDIAKEYVSLFNIMLDNISAREYEEILMQHEANHFHEPDLKDLFTENWYYFALGGFVILSALLVLAFSAQRRKRKAIQKAYETDSLTSLMTLDKFIKVGKEKPINSENNTYELISFDIDMFKSINANFGEEQGTQVIINIANALKEVFKNCNAHLCRKADEHFLIARPVGACGRIEDICNTYIMPSIYKVVGEQYNLSLSFGIVILDDSNETPNSYLAKVENARLRGKDKHETTFITFDDSMKKYYDNRLNITHHMKEALQNHEFSVVYQPKIDFNSLEVGGAEALVRWFPKEGRTIFPDEFIPVFEQNGFILSLDMYVLEDVCRFIIENEKNMQIPKISVNLSAHSVLAENLIERVSKIIELYEIKPHEIEFELTESAIERDTALFLQRVQELKDIGFIVSIDDFGAGVSSLNRLSAIEAHVLKLDKAFFDIKGKEENNKIVVSNVIAMAKELGMMIVAEGVETKEQATWLRSLKSDYAQGYYFAKPMSEKDFKELLESKKIYSLD